jgi:hypothetical protein
MNGKMLMFLVILPALVFSQGRTAESLGGEWTFGQAFIIRKSLSRFFGR